MAFFDAVPTASSANSGAAPPAPAPAVTPETVPSASPATPAPATGKGGFFSAVSTPVAASSAPTASTPSAPASFFDAVPDVPKPAPVASPYFYKSFPSGATEGASDELDTSGTPLLGYRNPGDTSTSTDSTRVDTTFDPTVAQPLTKDQYYNPRSANLRAQYHDKLGIQPSQQLDHAMALTLGGSNQAANLRAIPSAENQAEGKFEEQLAEELKAGKISYADAQIEEAKNKGLPVPWMPPEFAPKSGENAWDKFGDYVKGLFGIKTAQAATTEPAALSTPDALQTESNRLTAAGKEIQAEADHLSSLKSNLDTGDQSQVDSFNAQVKDFNDKLGIYQSQVDTFNKDNPITGQSIGEKTGNSVPAKPTNTNPIIQIGKDLFSATDSVVNDAADSIENVLSEWSPQNKSDTESKVADSITGALKAGADVVFSPVSLIMNAVKSIPVLGPLSTGIAALLGNIGQVGGSGALKILNDLPILAQHKTDLTPLVQEAGSLGAQIVAGDFSTGGEGFDNATAKLDTLQSNIRDLIKGSLDETRHVSAWKTLGSPKSLDEINSNYRQLAHQFHPDKPGGNADAMSSINNAKAILDEKGMPKSSSIIRSRIQSATGIMPNGEQQSTLPFERLPGYAPAYPKPFSAGLSAEPMEPVGFGEDKMPTAEGKPADQAPEKAIAPDKGADVPSQPISMPEEARGAEISTAIDRIAASKDPEEIAGILRDDLKYPARAGFTAEGRGTGPDKIGPLADKLSTISSAANVRKVLEGEDVTRKPSKEAFMDRLPPELQERATSLEIRREALEQNPAKGLTRYMATAGEFKGRLPEVTGKEGANTFGRKGDDIVTELGFKDSESARDAFEKYTQTRDEFRQEYASFQKDLKDYVRVEKTRESAARSARFQRDKRLALQEADRIADKERHAAALREKVKENAVRDSLEGLHKTPIRFEALRKDLNPLKFQDHETQSIIKEWRGNLLASKELAQEEFNKMAESAGKEEGKKFEDDMPTIRAYQGGELPHDQMNSIRAPFDKMYTEAYDRGVLLDYHKDYLPQVWANSPEDVKAASEKALGSKGLTKEEIATYLKGNELDAELANRLKLSRFFEQSKIFKDYAEGERYGLVPKYKNIPALAAYYREVMEATIANRNLLKQLAEAGKISPAETAPPHWVNFNAREFRNFRGPAKLVDMIDGFLRDESRLDSMQRLTKGISKGSKFLQEMALTTGVPFTNIHFMGIGMGYMSFEKMMGGLLTLRPDIAADELKNIWSLIRSNSNDASAKYFEANQKYMTMMARQRLEVGAHIARYDQIYGNVARNGMLKKAIGAAHDLFEKVFTEKMFASTLPQLNIETFKSTYNRLIADGIEDEDAQKLAAEVVRKSFGMSDFTMRSKDTTDRLNALFFAPRFRENMIGAYMNAGKSFNFKDASLARSRAFVVGFALMYAAYNYLNHKLNGNYMWDNPPGRSTYLRIPAPGGNVVYVPFNPSSFAVLRNVIEGADQLIHGQFVPAVESGAQNLSMPFQIASQILTDTNYFGNPIYNPNDTTAAKTSKIAAYAGAQFSPQWISGMVKMIEGTNQPWLETLSEANALPLSFSTTAKEQTSNLIQAKNAQTAGSYQSMQQAEAAYAKMKGAADAAAQYESLKASNPAMAAQVLRIATEDKEGLTVNERLTKSLGVSNGERAKAIAAAVNALPDQKSKAALWQRYESLKIISPQVATQLSQLLK